MDVRAGELDYKESWVPKSWCFPTVVLEKTLERPLDCKEIQPVHPNVYQSWTFIGRTDAEAEASILWPSDAKSWLIRKDLDAGQNWRQEEKGTTEDEVVGWHHQLNLNKRWEMVKDREAWRAAVHGVSKSWTEQLNNNLCHILFLFFFIFEFLTLFQHSGCSFLGQVLIWNKN